MRRIRSVVATLLEAVAGPLGWDVLVGATQGLPGIDRFALVRRPAGAPRPRRLAPRTIP